MDVVKHKTKPLLPKWFLLTLALLLIVVAAIYARSLVARVELDKKDLLITHIKQGDLKVTVDGYGKLVSKKKQLITAYSQATVEEIVLKPGALVTQDSIIVKLANPELFVALENAQQQLAQLTANLRQLKVHQQRELLTEKAVLTELTSQYESAKLKRVAEKDLAKQGIVSAITYQQSQLHEQQLARRIEMLTERLEQLSLVHTEAVNIQEQRIKQQQGQLHIAQQHIDKLTVRAGFDGVVQRLAVDLGQRVSPGQEIALIGSTRELIAEIKVPQTQVAKVALGQEVLIDTRQSTIQGVIARIDPIVEDNSVLLDVSFTQALPHTARPEQNIDASIITKSLANVKYIERPAKVAAQSNDYLYQLNKQQNLAHRVELTFGEKTSRYVELKTDIAAGTPFIISDLSNYRDAEIAIN